MGKGLVHVYTGDGKGKTTSAYGLAVRAIGAHKRVLILQFLKPNAETSGENAAFRQLRPKPTVVCVNHYQGWLFHTPEYEKNFPIATEEIRKSLDWLEQEWQSGKYDMVILDEINNAMDLKVASISRVIELIKTRPEKIELVLTGRNAPQEIIALADYVTEMKSIKHPADSGVKPRKGIEF
ncbi:MAG: cob(I)yrinic acid a,c-diamide adenosyltransferase [bacterium]|nr:cob(I)yrinic acid a,c-diamide adenosyltransferase [bacterium]